MDVALSQDGSQAGTGQGRESMDARGTDREILRRLARRLAPDAPDLSRASGRRAAVLVPLVEGAQGFDVLLTRRSADMPAHAGQIAFPGGGMAAGETALQAALRETGEEVGIGADFITPLGFLPAHETATGFVIAPLVGVVGAGYPVCPCAREVAEVFTIPLAFFMDARNHRREEIFWRGKMRRYWVMQYGAYRVWGATAAILRQMWELVHDENA